jgi:hypothetical protein
MNDNQEMEYRLNEAQAILLGMRADTAKAQEMRSEIIEIVKAWHRGELLPASAAPVVMQIYALARYDN